MARKIQSQAISRRGLMLVLSSPSGAGKTTLSRKLLAEQRGIELSISVTTRPKRRGEVDGRHYHFIDRRQFDRMACAGELLEHAEVFGNCYGTPRKPVEKALKAGRDVLFDIDWQGTQQLREKMPRDLVSVFVLPPSIPELERRLHTRAQDDGKVIRARMAKAGGEMTHWAEYDYVVVNREFDRAFAEVRAILAAERLKRERQTGLSTFVRGLQSRL
jgi:guanylate kinase